MKSMKLAGWLFTALLLSSLTVNLQAQNANPATEYKPEVGQAGKDVIWVPTPERLVTKMLEIANVTADDYLIDLGSGDGRTVIAAAKLGAKALGIEYNTDMVLLSKKNAEEAGVTEKADFIKADIFEYDFSEATVVTMFLLPELNLRLRPLLLNLKPGTRIVSNTFTMGEWVPDKEVKIDIYFEIGDEDSYEDSWSSWNTALMWIVPAKVEGKWKFQDGEITFHQDFQMITGTYKSGNKIKELKDGKLNGNTITFYIDNQKYTGHLNGDNTMEGTVHSGSVSKEWVARFSEI
jgi:SAM-dependent methyltransferase